MLNLSTHFYSQLKFDIAFIKTLKVLSIQQWPEYNLIQISVIQKLFGYSRSHQGNWVEFFIFTIHLCDQSSINNLNSNTKNQRSREQCGDVRIKSKSVTPNLRAQMALLTSTPRWRFQPPHPDGIVGRGAYFLAMDTCRRRFESHSEPAVRICAMRRNWSISASLHTGHW